MRARTATHELERQVIHELRVIREAVGKDEQALQAMATVETFIAVALKVLSKTNPSKVRDCATVFGIKHAWDSMDKGEQPWG